MTTLYTGKSRRRGQAVLLRLTIAALSCGLAICFEFMAKSLPIPGLIFPYGGTVSLTCLPLVLNALIGGMGWGIVGGFTYGLLNFFIDGYELVIGSFFFDYLLAFGLIGLVGLFSSRFLKGKWWLFYPAMVLGMGLRYLGHGFSGALFFGQYAPDNLNPWFYSFVAYNAPYCGASLGLDLGLGSFCLYPLGRLLQTAGFRPLLKPRRINHNIGDKESSVLVLPPTVFKGEIGRMIDIEAPAVIEAEATFKTIVKTLSDASIARYRQAESLETLERLAGQGYLKALVLAGILAETGTFVEKDLNAAEKYYEKAVFQGSVNALFRLGALYLADNAKRNLPRGVELISKAADQGLPEALASLGEIYEKGINMASDKSKAAVYYLEAGNRGLGYGYYLLSSLKADQGQMQEAKEAYQLARQAGYNPQTGLQDFFAVFDW